MDLRRLEIFVRVAELGSFSRAADSLHLSQPAVSLHIRQLEERAGHRLLERVGKRAFPTRAGQILLEHAVRALAELEPPLLEKAQPEAELRHLEVLRGFLLGDLRGRVLCAIAVRYVS